MRLVLSCLTALLALGGGRVYAQGQDAPGFPVQLEMSVAHAPTAFPSAGRSYLVYEIYLRNFASSALTLRRLEVLGDRAGMPLAAFEGAELEALLLRLGAQPGSREPAQPLSPGGSLIVYVSVPLDGPVPPRLSHRVFVGDASLDGAAVSVSRATLPLLGPPVKGSNWRLFGGPDNRAGHRRGIVVFGGRPEISRRYATDWVQIEAGQTFVGDRTVNSAYLAYGEEVLAVADAKVLAVRDGQPENTPGQSPPRMSFDAINGNYIIIDLGKGLFARYLHLQPGSIRVRAGQRIRRGQFLALVGNSGDSRQPHLHFDVSSSPDVLAGEGVPFLIDEYWLTQDGGTPQRRVREVLMPSGSATVGFGN